MNGILNKRRIYFRHAVKNLETYQYYGNWQINSQFVICPTVITSWNINISGLSRVMIINYSTKVNHPAIFQFKSCHDLVDVVTFEDGWAVYDL